MAEAGGGEAAMAIEPKAEESSTATDGTGNGSIARPMVAPVDAEA
jgi:hypothetical protein